MSTELKSVITFNNRVNSKKSMRTIKLQSFLNSIANEEYADVVEHIKNITDDESRQDYKRLNLPSIRIAGEFSGLKGSSLTSKPTNLLIVDFDHISKDENILNGMKTKVSEDEFTFFVFVSPSGDGLKVGIKLKYNQLQPEWNDYKKSFIDYYKNKFGIVVDTSKIGIAAPCFYSSDKDLFINKNAKVFEFVEKKSLREKAGKNVETKSKPAPTKTVKAKSGFDLSETYRRLDAMQNGVFHDECLKIGEFIGDKLKFGKISNDDKDALYAYGCEAIENNMIAKPNESLGGMKARVVEHCETLKNAIEHGYRGVESVEINNEIITQINNKFHFNVDAWKEIIKSAPYYTYGKGYGEKIMKRRGHFLQISEITDRPNLLSEVIARENLSKTTWEYIKEHEKKYCHDGVFTGKIQSADWLNRMPRMENVYWFDNQLVHVTKDDIKPVKKYSDVFGDDNPILAEMFSFQHHDILGIRDSEHITGSYLLKNRGNITIEDRREDVILLPELIEFIIDICREYDGDEWVRNRDREEDVKYLMGKYITTNRGDEKDKMLWICDANPMNSGRTGKTLLAKIITFLQQTSYRDGRSLGERADLKFAFANFDPAVHNTIFLDEWLADISPIYTWTTGECVTHERKNINLVNLSKRQTPQLVATSNTMPRDFRKSSNKGRIDYIIVSNYIKANNFDKNIEYKDVNKLMQWEANDPKWNIFFNDLLILAKNYLKNPRRKMLFDPMSSLELIKKEFAVPDSFCNFVKNIDERVDTERNWLIAQNKFDPKSMRKRLKVLKLAEIEELYKTFCRKNNIDADSPDYVDSELLFKVKKISKYVWINPIKTTRINTFGLLKTEIEYK